MKFNIKSKEKIIYIIFVIFCIFFAVYSAIIQPVNAAPDEDMKMEVCKYIANHGTLPHGGDEEIRDETWGISYAFTPYIPYIVAGGFIKITSFFTDDVHTFYIAARMVSVLCYLGFIIFSIKISKKLFSTKIYQIMFLVFTLLLPQMIFIGSYINNDSFAMFSIAIIINYWIDGIKNKWRISDCIKLAVGLGLCALSYYNAYGYILTSIFVFVISMLINKQTYKEIIKKGLIIFFVAFIIAGWWFIRNAIIYNGDFLGLETENEYSDIYAVDEFKASNRKTLKSEGKTLTYMLFEKNWIQLTIKSFVAIFGCMDVVAAANVYILAFIIFIGGGFGFSLKIFSKKYISKLKSDKNQLLLDNVFIVNMILSVFLSIYYSYESDFQPQGRYIMPMLIPFMYFLTSGYENIFENIIARKIKNKVILNVIRVSIIILWLLILNSTMKTLIMRYK